MDIVTMIVVSLCTVDAHDLVALLSLLSWLHITLKNVLTGPCKTHLRHLMSSDFSVYKTHLRHLISSRFSVRAWQRWKTDEGHWTCNAYTMDQHFGFVLTGLQFSYRSSCMSCASCNGKDELYSEITKLNIYSSI